jgi:hypothetical protein
VLTSASATLAQEQIRPTIFAKSRTILHVEAAVAAGVEQPGSPQIDVGGSTAPERMTQLKQSYRLDRDHRTIGAVINRAVDDGDKGVKI